MTQFSRHGTTSRRLAQATVLAFGIWAVGGVHAAGMVSSSMKLPLEQNTSIGNCGVSDSVNLAGQVHLVVKFRPGQACRVHTNLLNGSATSMATGAKYRVTGANNFVLQCAADSSFAFSGSYRVTPAKSCKPGKGKPTGKGKATFLPLYFHVTLDSKGAVSTASVSADPAQP